MAQDGEVTKIYHVPETVIDREGIDGQLKKTMQQAESPVRRFRFFKFYMLDNRLTDRGQKRLSRFCPAQLERCPAQLERCPAQLERCPAQLEPGKHLFCLVYRQLS
jgi:hypothetical protein